MTFSICVRERYTDDDGDDQVRYGVAVTTRLPGVGTLCPFASADGAVATQSLVNVELGRKGIEYLGDGTELIVSGVNWRHTYPWQSLPHI